MTVINPEMNLREARAIAKDAYLYGWPISENYNTFFSFINQGNTTNQILNEARVYTPEDKTVVTPNSDTPYSYIWADLRAEPLVITVPSIPEERYFSFQLIDLYTHNFAYIGTRTTGSSERSSYLLAGPGWKDKTPPAGIKQVFHCETELCLALVRTQLFDPNDLDNVKEIQARYRLETLSQFQDAPAPPAAPVIDSWPVPLKGQLGKTLNLFSTLDFLLQFCPTHRSEVKLMERLAKIGIGNGADSPFDMESLSPAIQGALQAGVADAWEEFAKFENEKLASGEVTSGDLFGARRFLKNNYLYRFAGAKIGLYGNSREEAFYPMYTQDSRGHELNGGNQYELTVPADQLPAKAFWSITMYDQETQLLVDNPIDRYLVNQPMWDLFAKNSNGSVTFYIQFAEPQDDKQKQNWLPAPNRYFYMAMRLYLPKDVVLNNEWTPPELSKVNRH